MNFYNVQVIAYLTGYPDYNVIRFNTAANPTQDSSNSRHLNPETTKTCHIPKCPYRSQEQ